MIILNSIGSNTFKLQLSDSILWTDTALGEPFTLTITNRMDNTPKVLVYPQEFASTSRTVSFQITGVSTLAGEDYLQLQDNLVSILEKQVLLTGLGQSSQVKLLVF